MARRTATESRRASGIDEMAALAGGFLPVSMLPKGSPGWLQWRELGVGESEVASLMYHAESLGVKLDDEVREYIGKPPAWAKTPRQLWRWKTGHGHAADLSGNPHIERGRRLRDPARVLFNEQYGTKCVPYCFVDTEKPHRRVSLDGLDRDQGILIQIKAPARVPAEPPPHVVVQAAYQWAVIRKAVRVRKVGIVLVTDFKGQREITPMLFPKVHGLGDAVLAVTDAFWGYITRKEEPLISGSDAVARMDAEWRETAAAYLDALDAYEQAKGAKEALRDRLENLAAKLGAYPQVGGSIRIERQVRRGNVDYRQALEEITGMSKAELELRLEEYRKTASETFVIRDLRRKQ